MELINACRPNSSIVTNLIVIAITLCSVQLYLIHCHRLLCWKYIRCYRAQPGFNAFVCVRRVPGDCEEAKVGRARCVLPREYRAHTSCITEVQKYVRPTVAGGVAGSNAAAASNSKASAINAKSATSTVDKAKAAIAQPASDSTADHIAAVLKEKGAVNLRELKRELRSRYGYSRGDLRRQFERAVSVRGVGLGVYEFRFE
jgi:LYAR-type C2HC zinc finger